MAERRRIKHKATFEQRLAEEAIKFRKAAKNQLPARTAFATCSAGRDGRAHQ